MAWLFIGLVALFAGVAVEGYARSPALRPEPKVSAFWYLLSKSAGIGLLISFVWAFFILPWWVVLLEYGMAFVVSVFFTQQIRHWGAAPAVSMFLIFLGAGLTAFGLLRPDLAMF